jgi:hypothetical protein
MSEIFLMGGGKIFLMAGGVHQWPDINTNEVICSSKQDRSTETHIF